MYYNQMELKKADYESWNQVEFITLNEFIYLAAGYEPLEFGMHGNAYLNLSNAEFKEYYKKVKRLGEELPKKTTEETEVKGFLLPESKYEATYLVKWGDYKKNPDQSKLYSNGNQDKEKQKIY